MRMDQSCGTTASDLIDELDLEELTKGVSRTWEEPKAYHYARAIKQKK